MNDIRGDEANNTLIGTNGDDQIEGLGGNDWIEGREGDDRLEGGSADDHLDGGAGNDDLAGGDGNDVLVGGDGINDLSGGAGNDQLFGGANRDWLEGGDGNDRISGGAGDDSLYGDYGSDYLVGGAGNDDFCYQSGWSFAKNGRFDPTQSDTIADFKSGEDKIDFLSLRTNRVVDGQHYGFAAHWSPAGPSAGGLWYVVSKGPNAHTDILVDTSWDGVADVAIRLVGTIKLKASDFLGIQTGHVPVAIAQTVRAKEDEAVSGRVTGYDADPDTLGFARELRQTAPTQASGYLQTDGQITSFDAETGAFVFQPDSNFSGIATFVFTARDDVDRSFPATISIDVAPVADAPTLAISSRAADFKIERLTTNRFGAQTNGAWQSLAYSPDGNRVLFDSARPDPATGGQCIDVFVKNLVTGRMTRIASYSSDYDSREFYSSVFSADGNRVLFYSAAANIVANDTNNTSDVFMTDIRIGATTRLSTAANGAQGNMESSFPVFSPDGTKVAFVSRASNFAAGDTNGATDIFIKDLASGAIRRVSTSARGAQANDNSSQPFFTPDGKKIMFVSAATNLVPGLDFYLPRIYFKDLASGAISAVSLAPSGEAVWVGDAWLSPDGRKIAFTTDTALDPTDTNNVVDIYIKDLATNAVTIASASADGVAGNGASYEATLSGDGTNLTFVSSANDLVAGDANGTEDIFVKNLVTGAITRVSTNNAGVEGDGTCRTPLFSPTGDQLVFLSSSDNLVPGDTNSAEDAFLVHLRSDAPPQAGDKIELTISASVTDLDGSESITKITLSGYPAGATFSRGVRCGKKWVITSPADIAALQTTPLIMTPPSRYTGTFKLSVAAQATDTATLTTGTVNDTATTTQTLPISIVPDTQHCGWTDAGHQSFALTGMDRTLTDSLRPSGGVLAASSNGFVT